MESTIKCPTCNKHTRIKWNEINKVGSILPHICEHCGSIFVTERRHDRFLVYVTECVINRSI